MATLLKDKLLNPAQIHNFAQSIHQANHNFDPQKFTTTLLQTPWPTLELKQRMLKLTRTLAKFLPPDYPEALQILVASVGKYEGFCNLCLCEFVSEYGLAHYDASIAALEIFTQHGTAEFAIRPFILTYPQTMQQLQSWTQHPSEHVRRLATEGCRPVLPWGIAIKQFQLDPSPILPIITALRHDTSQYVRRSVANNLNDISKTHPALVLQLAAQWIGHSPNTDRLVKHALRTLLKKGNLQAMALFNFAPAPTLSITEIQIPQNVQIGDDLNFSFLITTEKGKTQKIRLEYRISFVRKNGSTHPKTFFISETELTDTSKLFSKKHSFRPISTRTYYPGTHQLEIVLNGQIHHKTTFELKLAISE
ncbi:MAG: hypothetical protein RIS47_1579 [Bacteroidota bacterium]